MRLHHLSVTAFGPFVETAEVDFDTLSDAGLFLLSGATGAGKSSVLDAVCFALYGAVPGDRQHAGRLRSDQAPPALAPSVTLDVTLSGRRFRIIRSPAWGRPKKRGTGTTREQARVTVTELLTDDWVPLTSRLDEAGDLISGLLGMNLDQFCQVALLPQGHFQAFLRADSAQRHQLLARLFRTGRFERVEGWLRDHRLDLRRANERRAVTVGDLVSRLSEAGHRPAPEESVDLATVDDATLRAWARELRDAAVTERAATATRAGQAAADQCVADAALTAARELAASRTRVLAAADSLERLDLETERRSADLARLEQARRAAGVRPLARLADQRARRCTEAEERSTASLAAAAHDGIEVGDVAGELERVTGRLATLSALMPAEQHLAELRRQEADSSSALQGLREQEELALAETTSLEAVVAELERGVREAAAAAQRLPTAEVDLERLRSAAAARQDLARLAAERATASADHTAARGAVVELRERLLELRELRIAGMAAELAGGLVVGDDCPVCGSLDHPRPARPSGPPTDPDAERSAQRAVDDAQATELALRLRVSEVDASIEAARSAAGETEVGRASVAAAEALVERLREQAAGGETHRARLAEASTRLSDLAVATAERRVRATELTTALHHLRARGAELEAQVSAARGEHPEVRTAVAALTTRRDTLRAVETAADELAATRSAHVEARTALDRTAREAGFAGPEEARDAELSPEVMAELEQRILDHRAALTSARQVLDEPGARELLATSAPDVPAAEARASEAAEELEQGRAAEQAAARTEERVRRLTEELVSALDDWQPQREELALATRVSSFAEGKSPDNRLQMRLSAYVLAHRLSQVVAAANSRLSRMSDRRYSLEHVGRRGAGEARGGLSLAVRDDWSGEARDPATLSGGETFVVSLALALGLADVVAHEAGGTDLQTLFVDEGFGALDAETLDDVLDILDTLRENGRAVGVVSHVAEMRDRIPTQLVVTKARSGSTLSLSGPAG